MRGCRKRRKRRAKTRSSGGPEEDILCAITAYTSPTKRCLSNAIRAGLELFKVSHETLGKMVVCTTGKLNYGATDAHYLHNLSRESMEQGVAIDIFCVGSNHFDVPLLQGIVRFCGGHVHIHRSFDEKAFELNIVSATTGFRLSTPSTVLSIMLLLQLVHFTRIYHAMESASMCSALAALTLNRLLGQPSNVSGDDESNQETTRTAILGCRNIAFTSGL